MSKKPTEEPKKSRSRRRRLLRKPGGAKTKKPKTAALSSKSKETEKESTSLSQLNWHTFDVIVSLQLFGAGIFLLLAFIGGIVGTDGFWCPLLTAILLFICSLPGFLCIVRGKVQDGIFAFCVTQMASGFCSLFWGAVTLLDFAKGDTPEDWRAIAIMIVALWQFFTVVIVNSMPFKKVSMVDVVKRLKQKKRQERREAVADSRTEEMPSFVAQKSKIVINMEDSRSRSGSQPSQTTMQKRLASFLKTANERKKKKEIVRLQQKVGGIRNKSQLSYPVMKDNSQMSQTYSNPPSFHNPVQQPQTGFVTFASKGLSETRVSPEAFSDSKSQVASVSDTQHSSKETKSAYVPYDSSVEPSKQQKLEWKPSAYAMN